MFSLYMTDELFIDLQRWKSQTSTQFSQPCRPRQFNLDGFPTTCEQLRDEKTMFGGKESMSFTES